MDILEREMVTPNESAEEELTLKPETSPEADSEADDLEPSSVVEGVPTIEEWQDKVARQREGEQAKLEAIRLSLRLLGEQGELELAPQNEAEIGQAAEEIFGTETESPEATESGVGGFSRELLSFALNQLEQSSDDKAPLRPLIESLRTAEPLIAEALDRNLAEFEGSDIGQLLEKVIGAIETVLPPRYCEEVRQEIKLVIQGQSNQERLKELATVGLDFVPVIGPGKMLLETMKGQTLAGEKLSGWRRAVHGLEAGAFMIIDTLGRQSGQELGQRNARKGSEFLSSLLQQSSELAQRSGLSERTSGPIGRAAEVVKTNALLASLIDRGFFSLLARRQQKL